MSQSLVLFFSSRWMPPGSALVPGAPHQQLDSVLLSGCHFAHLAPWAFQAGSNLWAVGHQWLPVSPGLGTLSRLLCPPLTWPHGPSGTQMPGLLQLHRVLQGPGAQPLQPLSWGWEHGWGCWGLFVGAEEPGLGSEVAIAGRLHHPGSWMGRGSGEIL